LERVLVKTSFEALSPGERVAGFGKRGQVKERELATKGIEGNLHFLSPFSFGVTGIEAGMTHELQAFGWNVFDDEGNEI
jgi:hypothetical protein